MSARARSEYRDMRVLPLGFNKSPDMDQIPEFDALLHSSEPDVEDFVDKFCLSQAVTPDCELV